MKTCLLMVLVIFTCIKSTDAQILGLTDSTKAKISMKGLFQGRYLFSGNKNVDISGLQHTDGKAVDNAFNLKRLRLQFTSQISDRRTPEKREALAKALIAACVEVLGSGG